MLRGVLVFALLSWGVLAVPSLCNAGMLEHFCACGVSNNCSHEESCSADPCVIAKPAPESTGLVQSLTPAPAFLIFPIADCVAPATLDSRTCANHPAFAVPPALRSGARPLLI